MYLCLGRHIQPLPKSIEKQVTRRATARRDRRRHDATAQRDGKTRRHDATARRDAPLFGVFRTPYILGWRVQDQRAFRPRGRSSPGGGGIPC